MERLTVFLAFFLCAFFSIAQTPSPSPSPSASPSASPSPSPTPVPPSEVALDCIMNIDPALNLSDYLHNPPNELRVLDTGTTTQSVPQSDVDRRYIGVRVFCAADAYDIDIELDLKTRGPIEKSCTGQAKFCIVPSDKRRLSSPEDLRSSGMSDYEPVGRFLIKRQLQIESETIDGGDIELEVTGVRKNGKRYDIVNLLNRGSNVAGNRVNLGRRLTVTGATNNEDISPSCEVVVSGAVTDLASGQVDCPGGACDSPVNAVMVKNGELFFNANVKGLPGELGAYGTFSTRWSGGPDKKGMWESPPPNVDKFVTATVSVPDYGDVKCGINIRVLGEAFQVNLRKYMTCNLFDELRRYYYFDNNKRPYKNGYPMSQGFPGIDVAYGQETAEVPFKGIFNAAAADNGQIIQNPNGSVVKPPLKNRRFSEAIIVARPFFVSDDGEDPSTDEIGAAYWGRVDLANIDQTALYPTGNYTTEFDDDDLLVFQVFLARSQFASTDDSQDIDIRGGSHTESVPFHNFIDRTGTGGSDGIPFDYLSMFAEDSCFSMVQVSAPEVDGKEINSKDWPALKSASLCAFSRPFKFGDFRSGRVSLKVLQMTPERSDHEYPTELMTTKSSEKTCDAPENEPMEECWNIPKNYMPTNSGTDPFKDHDDCRRFQTYYEPKTVCSNSTSCSKSCKTVSHGRKQCTTKCSNSKSCKTIRVKKVRAIYTASCRVPEGRGCERGLAIRFTGYTQNMVAALGCAAKYDRSGEAVAPTLMNQGILPYHTFGGSKPKHYKRYSSNPDGKGYACIPCRFESDMAKRNKTLRSTTKSLPVDQDRNANRKPIFTFTKSRAPKSCIRTQEMSVRYFGAESCGKKNPPNNDMCVSENIPRLRCPTSDNANPCPLGQFCGGSNDAGRFKVRVCPGSGFAYDKVAVSWSPLVLDIAGTGMEVSRSFELARSFDMRGDGQKIMVDWPLNTHENAFLVRPDQHGKVQSVKQLFGDSDAINGFESLKKWDSNGDGVIDPQDQNFAKLRLWRDKNRDAIAQKSEIETLEEHGVAKIFLDYKKSTAKGVIGRELYGSYYNSKQNRFMNVMDQYFQEYITGGKRKVSSTEK